MPKTNVVHRSLKELSKTLSSLINFLDANIEVAHASKENLQRKYQEVIVSLKILQDLIEKDRQDIVSNHNATVEATTDNVFDCMQRLRKKSFEATDSEHLRICRQNMSWSYSSLLKQFDNTELAKLAPNEKKIATKLKKWLTEEIQAVNHSTDISPSTTANPLPVVHKLQAADYIQKLEYSKNEILHIVDSPAILNSISQVIATGQTALKALFTNRCVLPTETQVEGVEMDTLSKIDKQGMLLSRQLTTLQEVTNRLSGLPYLQYLSTPNRRFSQIAILVEKVDGLARKSRQYKICDQCAQMTAYLSNSPTEDRIHVLLLSTGLIQDLSADVLNENCQQEILTLCLKIEQWLQLNNHITLFAKTCAQVLRKLEELIDKIERHKKIQKSGDILEALLALSPLEKLHNILAKIISPLEGATGETDMITSPGRIRFIENIEEVCAQMETLKTRFNGLRSDCEIAVHEMNRWHCTIGLAVLIILGLLSILVPAYGCHFYHSYWRPNTWIEYMPEVLKSQESQEHTPEDSQEILKILPYCQYPSSNGEKFLDMACEPWCKLRQENKGRLQFICAQAYQKAYAKSIGKTEPYEYETIKQQPVCFRLIPPGRFLMNGQVITNGRPYYMAQNEITLDKLPLLVNRKSPEASQMLPDEIRWEYAARAGTTTDYNFGEDWPKSFHRRSRDEVIKELAAKARRPNAWGLYDCHSGVWELCTNGTTRGGGPGGAFFPLRNSSQSREIRTTSKMPDWVGVRLKKEYSAFEWKEFGLFIALGTQHYFPYMAFIIFGSQAS